MFLCFSLSFLTLTFFRVQASYFVEITEFKFVCCFLVNKLIQARQFGQEYHFVRPMVSVCPNIGDVNFDYLVNMHLPVFISVKLHFLPL